MVSKGRMILPGQLRLVLLLLFFMVALTIFVLNALAVFPWPAQSDSSNLQQSRLQKDPRKNVDNLNWPATTYLTGSKPILTHSKRMTLPGTLVGEVFSCDRSHFRTDICFMRGDVRMDGKTGSFMLYTTDENSPTGEERIKPYTRKWEKSCMDAVHEVKLKSFRQAEAIQNRSVLACNIHHSVPAVVFTTGGYTGNLYHEFHDGLIPLYITSQHLQGEVVFIIVEYHDWWMTKYGDLVRQISNYDVINFENDSRIHCFGEVTAGLHIHEELGIDPALMPHNESIQNFRMLLENAYTENRPYSEEPPSSVKPRLVIIVRKGTRVILNIEEIVALAERIGLEVKLCEPDPTAELKRLYWTLNSSEILLGVHGAAMTHFLFMRPGTVFIQVVPLGTSWAAATYYGEPAIKLGLQYIEYKIKPEESSLSGKYDQNDTILTKPEEIIKKGWWVLKEIYLEGQDVKLSLPRLEKTLLDAKIKALNFLEQKRATLSSSREIPKTKSFLSQEMLKVTTTAA